MPLIARSQGNERSGILAKGMIIILCLLCLLLSDIVVGVVRTFAFALLDCVALRHGPGIYIHSLPKHGHVVLILSR